VTPTPGIGARNKDVAQPDTERIGTLMARCVTGNHSLLAPQPKRTTPCNYASSLPRCDQPRLQDRQRRRIEELVACST